MRTLLFLGIFATTANARAAAPEIKAPAWRTVHFDHLDPAKVAQFEGARKAWLQALKAAGLSDARGFVIQVGASAFITLHPFADFIELDALQKTRRVAPAKLKDAVAQYDRASDSALVPPHRSELWSRAEYLDYRPAQGALDEQSFEAGHMFVEEVYPGPRGESYFAAWEQIRAALEKARYPLTRLGFSSGYGSGAYVILWLAKSRAEIERTPSMAAAVAAVLGRDKADALLKQMYAGVASSEPHDISRRRDLDSP